MEARRHLVEYYNLRTIEPGALASLHGKCAVIDERAVLVSSANITERDQERNVEAGLLVRDAQIASRLAAHFRALGAPRRDAAAAALDA